MYNRIGSQYVNRILASQARNEAWEAELKIRAELGARADRTRAGGGDVGKGGGHPGANDREGGILGSSREHLGSY